MSARQLELDKLCTITRGEIEALERQLADVETRIETEKGNADLGKAPAKDRQMVIEGAKFRFNKKPKSGIAYLKEHGFFDGDGTASEIAQFLRDGIVGGGLYAAGVGITKSAVGEYLGEPATFNLQVLDEFVTLHDMENVPFVSALRSFLWSFRLPGEAQKIDRIMENFAKRFCAQNPGVFANEDACYFLAFSTVMLNTSLHNPSVAKPPTIAEFVNMNRGQNGKADFAQDLLEGIYISIKTDEFKIPEDEKGAAYVFVNPDKKGYLVKEGGNCKSLMRRWVVIHNGVLYYFKNPPEGDETPMGIVPLENLLAEQVPKSKSDGFFYFALTGVPDSNGTPTKIKGCKTNSKGKVVAGNHTKYMFRTDDEAGMREWITCISANVQKDNAFAALYMKKMSTVQGINLGSGGSSA